MDSFAQKLTAATYSLSHRDAARSLSPTLPTATLRNWKSGRTSPPRWIQDIVLKHFNSTALPALPIPSTGALNEHPAPSKPALTAHPDEPLPLSAARANAAPILGGILKKK